MNKKSLQKAKEAKNDEFYTLYETIEKEMIYYVKYFEDKVIYCNTDNTDSNFWKYFDDNFEKFKLKKLITTKYNKDGNGEKNELFMENGMKKHIKSDLKENGSFDSDECIKILKESDIVITNPPFSLFRKFVDMIIAYEKKFIILGNKNSITYKNIYMLYTDKKIWLGVNGKSEEFRTDDNTENKKILISWFTNLNHNVKPPFLNLTKKYNEKDYPKYDNKDAINVNKIKDIPCDYDGLMGVPITFLDKHNSEQFEIIGFRKGNDGKDLNIKGKQYYFRILIKKR